jgi:hypothetical protein
MAVEQLLYSEAVAEEYQWFACVGPYLSAVRLSLQEELGAYLVPGTAEEVAVTPTLNTLEAIEQRLLDRLTLLRLRTGQVPDADPYFIDLFARASRETEAAASSAAWNGSTLAAGLLAQHIRSTQTAGHSQAAKHAAAGLLAPRTPTSRGEESERRAAEAATAAYKKEQKRRASERRERDATREHHRALAAAASTGKDSAALGGKGRRKGRGPHKGSGEDSP